MMDLHPNDRGPRGTFEGAISANGQLYCPATPVALLGLGPLARGALAGEVAAHDTASAELGRHKLAPITAVGTDGYQRVACPARAGKLRCPLKATSMALSLDHPSVLGPPEAPLPRCCSQRTITVAPRSTRRPARPTTTPVRLTGSPMPGAPPPSGPTPAWPIPPSVVSGGDGAACSAWPRTPSCTPWPAW